MRRFLPSLSRSGPATLPPGVTPAILVPAELAGTAGEIAAV